MRDLLTEAEDKDDGGDSKAIGRKERMTFVHSFRMTRVMVRLRLKKIMWRHRDGSKTLQELLRNTGN